MAWKDLNKGEQLLIEWYYSDTNSFNTILGNLLMKADTYNFILLQNTYPDFANVIEKYKNKPDYFQEVELRFKK